MNRNSLVQSILHRSPAAKGDSISKSCGEKSTKSVQTGQTLSPHQFQKQSGNLHRCTPLCQIQSNSSIHLSDFPKWKKVMEIPQVQLGEFRIRPTRFGGRGGWKWRNYFFHCDHFTHRSKSLYDWLWNFTRYHDPKWNFAPFFQRLGWISSWYFVLDSALCLTFVRVRIPGRYESSVNKLTKENFFGSEVSIILPTILLTTNLPSSRRRFVPLTVYFYGAARCFPTICGIWALEICEEQICCWHKDPINWAWSMSPCAWTAFLKFKFSKKMTMESLPAATRNGVLWTTETNCSTKMTTQSDLENLDLNISTTTVLSISASSHWRPLWRWSSQPTAALLYLSTEILFSEPTGQVGKVSTHQVASILRCMLVWDHLNMWIANSFLDMTIILRAAIDSQ